MSSNAVTQNQLKSTDSKYGVIHLLTGKTEKGEDFFAYVSVKPSLYEDFCRRIEVGENMNVEAFGKILHKGYGKKPSENDQLFVQDTYGIDPDFMDNLIAGLEARLNRRS